MHLRYTHTRTSECSCIQRTHTYLWYSDSSRRNRYRGITDSDEGTSTRTPLLAVMWGLCGFWRGPTRGAREKLSSYRNIWRDRQAFRREGRRRVINQVGPKKGRKRQRLDQIAPVEWCSKSRNLKTCAGLGNLCLDEDSRIWGKNFGRWNGGKPKNSRSRRFVKIKTFVFAKSR